MRVTLTADERAARAQRGLELRRAGIPLERIVSELGFKSAEEAAVDIRAALDAVGVMTDPEETRLLALDRIDRMIAGTWARAAKGEASAIDRVLRLQEDRIRLVGTAKSTVMVEAYETAVAALVLKPADGALVAAGHRLAERIDAASGTMDPTAETKAMYLMPHLMTVLRELGATPAARASVKSAKEETGGKLASLRAQRDRKSA